MTDTKDEAMSTSVDHEKIEDTKNATTTVVREGPPEDKPAELFGKVEVLTTPEDLVTHLLHVEDDPSLNPWTVRTWVIGIGLALFGSTLATVYYFKPQIVLVSTIFLAVIAYIAGQVLSLIPRRGKLGRFLNPHPFNIKEHAAIVIMASAAANCALGVEVLAVQRLYYDDTPNSGAAIFMLFASQLLGMGIAGLMRHTLVFPTVMLYPNLMPINSMLETLHRDKHETSKRLKVFYIGFAALFLWEVFPEYIMPILTGVSVFCLANRNSLVFTNIFGGTNANEGLGFLSFSLDWVYVGALSPLSFPLQTLINSGIGYLLGIVVFASVYYSNIWDAQDFPFLSQMLYSNMSTSSQYIPFNQSLVIKDNAVDLDALEAVGAPYLSATYVVYLITANMAITATFSHLLLWNYNDISTAWSFLKVDWSKLSLTSLWHRDGADEAAGPPLDPHYQLLRSYKAVPNWWFGIILLLSLAIGIGTTYGIGSTLPWWGFIIACLLSAFCILFFGAQAAITGFTFIVQPIIQMIGGYLHPGLPVANMYFTLFGYNSVAMGQALLSDLKFGQYAHLSPRCTFTMQIFGTLLGAVFNYIVMESIVTNQATTLLSIEGTNLWSGQNVQFYNSQAISWSMASSMFGQGARYPWVTLAFVLGFLAPLPFYILHRLFPKGRFWYLNTAIILAWTGALCAGINSSNLSFYLAGFISQYFLRRYKSRWFVRYNYVLGAAMAGGTQVLVFILTFAVNGAGGKATPFPAYWGNNIGQNFDYCMFNPANGE